MGLRRIWRHLKDYRRRDALAAYCGKKEIMSMVSPSGPVYQAGTLGKSGGSRRGIATLKLF